LKRHTRLVVTGDDGTEFDDAQIELTEQEVAGGCQSETHEHRRPVPQCAARLASGPIATGHELGAAFGVAAIAAVATGHRRSSSGAGDCPALAG
jgi:hypothetical protein